MKSLQIEHSVEDAAGLLNFIDVSRRGYVNFTEFAATIQPNILHHNSPRLNETESNLSTSQPSLRFLQRQLENLDAFNKAHEQLRNELKPNIEGTFMPSYRSSLRPKSSKIFMNARFPEESGRFITEDAHLLLKNRSRSPISLAEEDKARKAKAYESKLENIRRLHSQAMNLVNKAEEFGQSPHSKRHLNKAQELHSSS